MQTSRISSGFDIEFQLGANWFRTAIELLVEKGVIDTGGVPVIITDIAVIMDPEWDLAIQLAGLGQMRVKVDLNNDGTELILTTDNPLIPPQHVPFGALKGLAEPPAKAKVAGGSNHQNTVVFLANLDIHAEPQSGPPLPDGEILPRGDATAAQSFLEIGKDVALGLGSGTLERFANDIWHTTLRADDGSHPLPDAEHQRGSWSLVTGRCTSSGDLQFVLEGDIPVDSPLIDVVPDPHVVITLTLGVAIVQGRLVFSIDTDTDVDTGLLGDLFGGLVGAAAGAIIGLVVGLFTGGLLIAVLVGAGIGFIVGVIAIEVVEYVAEGIVQREIKARIDGEQLPDVLCCDHGVIQIATPSTEDGFNLSVLDAIPSSISIHDENPPDEDLYRQSLLIGSVYDDVTVDAAGFGAAGISSPIEVFTPEVASISSFNYVGGQLQSITFEREEGAQQTLQLQEVFDRVSKGGLQAPLVIRQRPGDASLHIPNGKLASVCLEPTRIRRENTIIREFEFLNGARLLVPDAVALQDAAVIALRGYQLIHPRNYHPYFRAPADSTVANNLESLPTFA
jgi:hypothetical protein